MDARLILDGAAEGDWNMAVDEALLQSAEQGDVCLRFYSWSPATLSLGYFQPHAQRQEHPASTRLPLVRRSTGGGAIVHDRELTYSFTTPISERFSHAPQRLVQRFHDALCRALADWGLSATLCGEAAANRTARHAPFLCFQRRASEDVICADQKIAGSAQRRHRGALLQHGSVLLATSAHAPELPGIADLASRAPTLEELRDAWLQHLTAVLGHALHPSLFSPTEHQQATARRDERFTSPAWNLRR